jgi:hypothetical protein
MDTTYSSVMDAYYDDISINSLLKSVEDFERLSQEASISRLSKENETLGREVKLVQDSWIEARQLLQAVYECAVLLQNFLQDMAQRESAAKKGWLASWGIYEGELPENFSHSQKGWI